MEWTAPIDIYCERTGPEFWSEPINAISNLSFFIAALIAYVAAKRADRLEPLTILMIAMAVIVGTGSFLFHSYATLWAAYADTIPILIFILIQIYTVVRRYLAKPVWLALLAPVLFVIFTFGFDAAWASALPSINGSEEYFPVLMVIPAFGFYLNHLGHPAGRWLLAAAATLALSVTFRSIDSAVCGALPIGVHYMWHALNGLLFAIVILAFIRYGAKDGQWLARRGQQG